MTFVQAGHRDAWDEFAMAYYVRTETYCSEQGFETHVVPELWLWLLDHCWQAPTTNVWEWICEQAAKVAATVQAPMDYVGLELAAHMTGPPHDFGEVDD